MLFFHVLSDRVPHELDITVPQGDVDISNIKATRIELEFDDGSYAIYSNEPFDCRFNWNYFGIRFAVSDDANDKKFAFLIL